MTVYRYASETRVARIEERHRTEYVSGTGKDAVTRQVSTGWWVVTQGPNPVVMQAGLERPPFGVGAKMRVIVEVES